MVNKGSSLVTDKEELCNRCKSIPATAFFSRARPWVDWYERYGLGPAQPYQLIEGSNAFEELKLSAAAGCVLCKLFQDALETSIYHPNEHLRKEPEFCQDGIRLERKGADDLKIVFGRSCEHLIDARLVVFTDETSTRSIGSHLDVVETESDSPANFALARSWLAKCCKHHVDCRDPQEFGMPRRLLDIAMASNPGMIRLVSVLDLPTKSRSDYAALSHCWGSFRPLQTNKDNLWSHMQEIPEARLPQTFHDAVRTARELGLRYLWIDSLCIVQDDPTDFEAECARMNIVFANALCTISASDARDCRDGLFRSRTMKPIRLTYESDGFNPKTTVRLQPTSSGSWMKGLQGPLQRRAWVLQERHLSPRIIHYTKKYLMWGCRIAIALEHHQMMRDKSIVNKYLPPQLSSDRFLDGRLNSEPEDPRFCRIDKFRSLHDRWYRMVEDYSHRDLSRPEDRLPALSGFAAEWKRLNPEDEYLAGLWKSDFFYGLVWFPRSARHDILRRSPESAATWPPSSPFKGIPSWSWASFDGPVAHIGDEWRGEYDLDECDSGDDGPDNLSPPPSTSWPLRLHHATTTTEQLNPFGHVSKGEITVSGWSIVVPLSESDVLRGALDSMADAPKAYRLRQDTMEVHGGIVYFDYDPFHLPEIKVRLLLFARGKIIRGSRASVCGLALLQLHTDASTLNENLYKRVGMFELEDTDFWPLRRKWEAIKII